MIQKTLPVFDLSEHPVDMRLKKNTTIFLNADVILLTAVMIICPDESQAC